VTATVGGLIRGLIGDGSSVSPGTKIGDIDPRGGEASVHEISDKALAVGGGVVEAVLTWLGCNT
jgi:xanthine dehydrogenase accessory factor